MSSGGLREIALDTETTGLNPKDGHRIVEIGCIELINRVRTGNNYHTYVNPRRDMPDVAFNVHGLSSEFLSDKPIFTEIAKEFTDFIKGASLVIHNAAFDMGFINSELENIGMLPIPIGRAIDTLQIARKKFPGAQATLDALCRRYGIDLSRRTKHGALLDADLLADVYVELKGGKQEAMNLDRKKGTKERKRQTLQRAYAESNEILSRKAVPLSSEEVENHSKLLKSITSPIWKDGE